MPAVSTAGWGRRARPVAMVLDRRQLAVTAALWSLLAVLLAAGPGMAHAGRDAGMPGMDGMTMPGMAMPDSASSGSGPAFTVTLAAWIAMAAAMMLPGALPAVRHVAVNSLRWRRRRAVATFVAVYLASWSAFGLLVLALAPLWSSLDATAVSAAALILAAAWQLTPAKRSALRACHIAPPLPPRGPRATAGVVRFAARNGAACVGSCWALMLAMTVAAPAALWTVVVTGIVTAEKLGPRPRRTARTTAALLAAGTLALTLV
jgi:predicted metal-binding membrane protein